MQQAVRRFFLRHLRKLRGLPSHVYVKIHYEYFSGKKLDLKNPVDFNAKLEWYKVYYRPRLLNKLVDKYAVRSYVKDKIGEQFLNECYGVYTNPEDIPFDELPESFVIKPTHTSSYNLIVKNKVSLDIARSKKSLKKWLRRNQYYKRGQEWAYKDVEPRLVVEKFLSEKNKTSLVDYKFYCFNGKPKFVDVHLDRANDHKQRCFDLNFNALPFNKSTTYEDIDDGFPAPSNLEEMVKCAEILAGKLPFVRVDFYSIDGKTIFGEMTFYPSDARKPFYPQEYNKVIGDYFELPDLPHPKTPITKI